MSYSLRLSVTDRCSLRCVYCMPVEGGSFVSWREVLSFDEIVRFARVMRSDFGLDKIRITGGEPLLRPGLAELVARLAALSIGDLAMTTNGQWLAEHAAPLKRAGLRRVNVSLDSLDAANYRVMARGGELHRSLDGIEAALDAGLAPLKLNMVVMRGRNDHEVLNLARFGLARGCTVRFLELMPIGIASDEFDRRFIASAEIRGQLATEFELTPLPETPGASSREFRATHRDGRETTIGFISPYSHPFCTGCRRLRLTAGGVLMGCLARSASVPLAPLLRGPGDPEHGALARAIAGAMAVKRDDGAFAQPRAMAGIGG